MSQTDNCWETVSQWIEILLQRTADLQLILCSGIKGRTVRELHEIPSGGGGKQGVEIPGTGETGPVSHRWVRDSFRFQHTEMATGRQDNMPSCALVRQLCLQGVWNIITLPFQRYVTLDAPRQ